MIGELIGHYRVTAALGMGGIGVVYRAHDCVLERPVAIKFVGKGEGFGFGDQNLLDEARSASALNHPNICVVHEVGESGGHRFIVMELVDGQPLSRLIPSEGLSVEQLANYGAQIASALDHAHERGVVHRDLKAENVVITADGRAKVLDFGLAVRTARSLDQSHATFARSARVAGTLPYMAPEVLRGTWADARSDVWALGVLLYKMSTGHTPFVSDTEYELAAQILDAPLPPLPSGVPAPLRSVIERCLSKAREKRPQRAGEVQLALEALRSDSALETAPMQAEPELAGPKRLLVLPFSELPPGGDDAFLADGLTDEIITDLSSLDCLRVISRTSSMRLKGSSADIASLGQQLRVDYVLEGSVRRAGPQLRIAVKLVEVASDTPVWAQKFSETQEDVFAIQERVSRKVVESLELKLSAGEERRLGERKVENLRVYEAYLKAKQEMMRFSAEGLARALEHLQAGLALESDNALLISAMGQVHWQYVNAGISADPACLDQARACAGKLLSRDADSLEGHRLLGLIKVHEGDCQGAVRQLKRVLARQPDDPDTLMWYCAFASLSGKAAAARPWAERLLEIDPLTPMYQILPGLVALMDGRFADALEVMRKGYGRNLDNPPVRLLHGQVLALNGELDEASAVFDALLKDMPESHFARLGLFYRHALSGERELALGALGEEAKAALGADLQYSWMIAQCHALAGARQEALSWLERAVDRGFINHPLLARLDPFLADLRGEPRFEPLMAEVESRFERFEF